MNETKERKISDIALLALLKTQMMEFLDTLVEQGIDSSSFIHARFLVSSGTIPIIYVMKYICKELLPLESQVKSKDDRFFLEHNILFSQLDEKRVNRFKDIWQKNVLSDAQKEIIWEWFEFFLGLSSKFMEIRPKFLTENI